MNNKTCGECCHLEKTEHFSFRCKHCNSTVSSSNTACNHFRKQYGICPECGSYLFSYEHTEDNDWQLCICDRCGCSGTPDEFLYNSVFARITVSPEVLAEKLVYPKGEKIRCVGTDHRYEYHMTYGSVLFPGITFEDYGEAFIKTVDKLKEI